MSQICFLISNSFTMPFSSLSILVSFLFLRRFYSFRSGMSRKSCCFMLFLLFPECGFCCFSKLYIFSTDIAGIFTIILLAYLQKMYFLLFSVLFLQFVLFFFVLGWCFFFSG